MRFRGMMRALLLVGASVATSKAVRGQTARATVFTHVTVVDVVTGRLLDDQTVVVSGNRISEMGAASKVKVPPSALAVDGRGEFLIPGLWDMHSHLFENSSRNGADNHDM